MPSDLTPPVFLERRSYRQRRMMDTLRILPFAGLLLWMLPVLWPNPDVTGAATNPDVAQGIKMSKAIVYVFCVWVTLILSSALIWHRLRSDLDERSGPPRVTDDRTTEPR